MDATAYQLGAQVLITPSAVLDEMNTVNSVTVGLGREIAASEAEAGFKQAFKLFYDEWDGFYRGRNTGLVAWFSRGFGVTYEKVLDFKRRALEWQTRFRALGFKSQTEVPGGPGTGTISWLNVAILGGVGVGAYIVFSEFLKKGRGA